MIMNQPAEVESLFFAALEKADATERASFLEAACGDDAALRQSIERMLAAHPNVGSFLESPGTSGGVGKAAGGRLPPTVGEPMIEKPGTVIGPYKLLEQIGEGGFGVVYMAEQTEPVRRKVALKILKPGMDTRQVV